MNIKLRPYQKEAVEAMAGAARGICVAPAGSGKTVIAASVVGEFIARSYRRGLPSPRVLWLAHTREQVQQGKDARAMIGACGFADLRVVCYASNPDAGDADCVVVDECHWAGAPAVMAVLKSARADARMYGFTATPIREDGIDIAEIIGPVLYTVGRQEIQNEGGVLPAVVRVISVGAKDELDELVAALAETYYTNGLRWCDSKNGTDEQWKRCQYRAAVNIGVKENEQRDSKIVGLCFLHRLEDDSVLVLVDSKEHGRRLEKRIPESRFVCSGSAGRVKTIQAFKDGAIRCLICTSLADEGLDVPVANVLIMAGAGKAFGKVIQRTGRVLRPHPGKDRGVIYDFHDLGHGMLNAQHWRRRKIYKASGYAVEAGRI
jgi:superfamily II DNA or RNA helicase